MWHYTETALQDAGCPLQSEKSKALSLSGVITEFFLPIWHSLYANPGIINEFDFEVFFVVLKTLVL